MDLTLSPDNLLKNKSPRSSFNRLTKPVRGVWLAVGATLTLATVFQLRAWLIFEKDQLANQPSAILDNKLAHLTQWAADLQSLLAVKEQELETFRSDFLGIAQSKKGIYETGLLLQEEKRLLEKQWDILITFLKLDGEAQRIIVMRGEQPVESYPLYYGIPQGFGQNLKALPNIVRIISKERFAHPERGKAEKVGEALVWSPPQVGQSTRSNALGEYVMFTDSNLVFHGPPLKVEEHEAFPHICLALPLSTAQSLYRRAVIGTKVVVEGQ